MLMYSVLVADIIIWTFILFQAGLWLYNRGRFSLFKQISTQQGKYALVEHQGRVFIVGYPGITKEETCEGKDVI